METPLRMMHSGIMSYRSIYNRCRRKASIAVLLTSLPGCVSGAPSAGSPDSSAEATRVAAEESEAHDAQHLDVPTSEPRALGLFDNASLTPIIAGSWYTYSDGRTVRVASVAESEAVLTLEGHEDVALRLDEPHHRNDDGDVIAYDGSAGEQRACYSGRRRVPGFLPRLLLGEAVEVAAETDLTGLGSSIGFFAFSGEERALEAVESSDGRVFDDVLVSRMSYATGHGREIAEENGIRDYTFAARQGVGWVYGRVEMLDGSVRELWLNDWFVPEVSAHFQMKLEAVETRTQDPDPSMLIEIPGWSARSNLASAGPATWVGPFTRETNAEEIIAFAGVEPNRIATFEPGVLWYQWHQSPDMPVSEFGIDAESGQLLTVHVQRLDSLLGGNRLWVHFGNGLSFGATLESFYESGLLNEQQVIETGTNQFGHPFVIVRAGLYELTFEEGAYRDAIGLPIEGLRLRGIGVSLR